VSFAAFAEDAIARLIAAASVAPKVSLLVGAGASMEAGLPSWNVLVQRLLLRGAEQENLLPADGERARDLWLKDAGRDGPLGAAAIVDALAGDQRDAWVVDALYGTAGPSSFFPGPIARQVAALQAAFGDRLRVMTLNYDDLVETAMRETALAPVALATAEHRVEAGQVPVFHLHGYLGRDRSAGGLILSESDYQGMQLGAAWQDDLVRAALRDSTLIFVGTSLIDPNMLRYLHAVAGGAGDEHFAVFVRQGVDAPDAPVGLAEARERALTRRWQRVGVVPVFVDHYTDVAQVLAEVAHRRARPDEYRPLPERAASWLDAITSRLLAVHDVAAFARSQTEINSLLSEALRAAVATAEQLTGEAWDETLALSLWLCDRDGKRMSGWCTTDRLHLDPATIEPLDINEHSGWVAVRAYCQGIPLAEAHTPDGSRWRFIRGTPLTDALLHPRTAPDRVPDRRVAVTEGAYAASPHAQGRRRRVQRRAVRCSSLLSRSALRDLEWILSGRPATLPAP
jgi:hypothetical protein